MHYNKIPFLPTVLSLAIALTYAPVYAQNLTPEQVSQQLALEEQKKEENAIEVIEVTGLRASMAKAQELKMESDSIIDAIVAEDIGKLPDFTVAESLARITGVQVTRFNDEADSILIRGLPDVTTTYNGREFFTAELRRGQLQDFPSQAISGIEVYKSGTANLIEPGLAGLVNIRTRRPFDFEGKKLAGGLRYAYNDQSEKGAPSGNLLYSNRWKLDDLGEFGFLGNVTYSESEYYNGTRFNTTWFDTAQPNHDSEAPYEEGGFIMPARVGLYNGSGQRVRPSANIALQWRPNENLEIYFDGLYQGYRGEGKRDEFFIATGEWDWLNQPEDHLEATFENIVMVEGSDNTQVASMTKSWGIPPRYYRATGSDETNTYQYAVGAKWNTDRLSIETDLAYTDSEYINEESSFDGGLSFSPTFDMDFFGDGGATFSTTDWDVNDESTYEARGYYEKKYKVGGKGWQWRTDFILDTNMENWFHTVKAGVRYSSRDATKSEGNRYADFWDLHIPVSDIPFLEMELTHNPYRSDAQGLTQYLAPTRDSIANNADALAALAYEKTGENGYSQHDRWVGDLVFDPAAEWLAKEKNYAVYLQTSSYFELGDVEVEVYAGVRVARTEATNNGISTVTKDGVQTFESRTQSNGYTDILPNISFRAKLTEKVHLRAGFTQTVTKPNFGDLNPALNITQNTESVENPNAPDTDITIDANGSGGNPDLQSLTSDNYDLSLEYYFSETGYFSAAVFYRDLFGFINNYTRFVETPDYGTVKLNHPENAGEGKLKGWEISAQTFLDYDFIPSALHGVGFSVNITGLDGENRQPNADGSFGEFVEIPGLSKHTYNAAVFYEKNGFSIRLSYNKRDEWVNWYGATSPEGDFLGNKTYARSRLDFSANYDISENLTIYTDIANIQAKPFQNYTVNDAGYRYPQDIRDEGRYFGGGIRFSF
ncbi:MAG: TonB-dependent receptor [Colwellia sp.]